MSLLIINNLCVDVRNLNLGERNENLTDLGKDVENIMYIIHEDNIGTAEVLDLLNKVYKKHGYNNLLKYFYKSCCYLWDNQTLPVELDKQLIRKLVLNVAIIFCVLYYNSNEFLEVISKCNIELLKDIKEVNEVHEWEYCNLMHKIKLSLLGLKETEGESVVVRVDTNIVKALDFTYELVIQPYNHPYTKYIRLKKIRKNDMDWIICKVRTDKDSYISVLNINNSLTDFMMLREENDSSDYISKFVYGDKQIKDFAYHRIYKPKYKLNLIKGNAYAIAN